MIIWGHTYYKHHFFSMPMSLRTYSVCTYVRTYVRTHACTYRRAGINNSPFDFKIQLDPKPAGSYSILGVPYVYIYIYIYVYIYIYTHAHAVSRTTFFCRMIGLHFSGILHLRILRVWTGRTVNFQTKNLRIWSLGQTNYYIKEVGFLSAPTNFLAQ